MRTFLSLTIILIFSIAFAGSSSDLFYSKCSQCHGSELALKQKRDKKQWLKTIDRMTDRGLEISSKDADAIAAFLAGRK